MTQNKNTHISILDTVGNTVDILQSIDTLIEETMDSTTDKTHWGTIQILLSNAQDKLNTITDTK